MPGKRATTRDADRALALLRQGDLDGARKQARDGLGRARDNRTRGELTAVLARADLAAGDAEAAERGLEKAVRLLAQAPELQAEAELEVGRLRQARGDAEGALRALAHAGELFRACERPADERRALASRGEVLAAKGDHAAARAVFRSALELAGKDPPAWKLHRAIASAYAKDGRRDRAGRSLGRARAAGLDGDDELGRLLESADSAPSCDPTTAEAGAAGAGADADALARVVETLPAEDSVRLISLAAALGARITPQALVELILDKALAWTGAEGGVLSLANEIEPDGALRIDVHATRGKGVRPDDEVTLGIIRATVERGIPSIAADAGRELGPAARGRAVACVPLKLRRETLGALYLESKRPIFGARERALLGALAAHAAIVLDRSRETARLEQGGSRGEAPPRASEPARRALAQEQGVASGLVCRSRAMRNVMRLVEKVARTETPVLIEGETGTGKELLARTLHAGSARRAGPFVAESAASIPEPLLEAEIFGHAKGAFTGAGEARPGAFERAEGGTLFLDDVSDMPPRLQALLLRVLETREVRPVGAPAARRIDCRVIAASARDLRELVRRGEFREDLYFRLDGVRIRVPPLRERTEDIPALADGFLRLVGRDEGALAADARAALLDHAWPGNVRELKHAIERSALLAGKGPIAAGHLALGTKGAAPAEPATRVEPSRRELPAPEKTTYRGHVLNWRQLALVEYLRANGIATNRDYALLVTVSITTGWRDLNDLVAKKILLAEGRGRNTVYRLAP